MHKLQQKHKKRLNGQNARDLCVVATGGGAFKYYDEIKRRVGVEVLREDEMECLIIGESSGDCPHISTTHDAICQNPEHHD